MNKLFRDLKVILHALFKLVFCVLMVSGHQWIQRIRLLRNRRCGKDTREAEIS